MKLIQIKTPKHLEIFEKEWNAILEESNNGNPFIEYKFIYNRWSFLRDKEKIEIYAVKEHNRIIAFFPFQVNKVWFGDKVQFMALSEGNYMDFIVRKVDKDRTIMFAMDELIKLKKSMVFYLHGLLESTETINSLSDYLIARNLKARFYRMDNKSKLDIGLRNELSNMVKNVEFDNTRLIIFSTNIIKAKMYRNFLWIKEWSLSKILPERKSGKF